MSEEKSMWTGLLHAGIATFLGRPYYKIEDIPTITKAAVLGIPFDGTCIARTGTNYGPRALRDASSQFISYHPYFNIDIVKEYNLVDCGDVQVVLGNPKKTIDKAAEVLKQLFKKGIMPVILGGEHLISVAGTKAMSETYQNNLGLIVFDCHLDTAYDVGGELYNHCCPWPRTIELSGGKFKGSNIAIIGVGALNPKEEWEYAKKHGITAFTIEEIEEKGIEEVTKEAIKIAKEGTDGLYVSIDIDVLDAAFAPGTGVPTPGGLTSREIIKAIRLIGTAGFNAIDLTEVSPPYDKGGATAYLGCRILLDALAANARNLKNREAKT